MLLTFNVNPEMPPTKRVKKRGDSTFSAKLTSGELNSLKGAVETVEALRQKYEFSYEDVLGLLKEEKERIPATIFNDKLSSLESISRYLKDGLGLSYHEIAILLGRDERNIWHSCNKSLKKHPEKISPAETQFFVPLSLFAEKRFSILESIVVHLREEYSLSFKRISELVCRDQRTVWTAYSRAMKKMKPKQSSKIQKSGGSAGEGGK